MQQVATHHTALEALRFREQWQLDTELGQHTQQHLVGAGADQQGGQLILGRRLQVGNDQLPCKAVTIELARHEVGVDAS